MHSAHALQQNVPLRLFYKIDHIAVHVNRLKKEINATCSIGNLMQDGI